MSTDTIVRGRAASEAALISAAAELLAEVGPNAVSVRAIADRAGVNHGLVHHYFGSKAGLVEAVLARLSAESEAAIRERGIDAAFDQKDDRVRRHVRVLARVVLDNAAPDNVHEQFPVVSNLARTGRETLGLDDEAARLRAMESVALIVGWLLMEPWLLASGGFGADDADRLRDDLQPAMMRLATG